MPAAHTVGQVPQWSGSVCVFTHVVPHSVGVGAMQVVPHTPPAQTCPPGHKRAHPPQLLLSVCGSTHVVPPQSRRPVLQV